MKSLALCLLLLPSCFTTALWTHDPKSERPARSLRIALTPLALALDVITWPLQVAWAEDDDGDDACDE